MSLFSRLFGGKPRARREEDRIYLTRAAKWKALSAEPDVKLVAHFPATRREFLEFSRASGGNTSVALAGELLAPAGPDPNLRVVAIERHPLREHDERLCEWADSAAASITFVLSLDDALLSAFGGNLKPLVERLGMDASEVLVNGMLSKSIAAAQERIRKQMGADLPADSDVAWMKSNVSSQNP